MNIQGNIKMSLVYLEKAMEHVQRLASQQEVGAVTIIPELSLNICNALIYMKNYPQALGHADEAVASSKACINSLSRKMDQESDKSEQERLTQLFISQINLHIQGYQAKGQAYEKMKRFADAIKEYKLAQSVVEKNFGTENKMFSELVKQMGDANINLKEQSYTKMSDAGNSSMFGSGGSRKRI